MLIAWTFGRSSFLVIRKKISRTAKSIVSKETDFQEFYLYLNFEYFIFRIGKPSDSRGPKCSFFYSAISRINGGRITHKQPSESSLTCFGFFLGIRVCCHKHKLLNLIYLKGSLLIFFIEYVLKTPFPAIGIWWKRFVFI